jgi:hypothetical protein
MRKVERQKRLTEYLVELGADRKMIDEGAATFYHDRRFGEWLVGQEIITESDLALALSKQATDRGEYATAELWLERARALANNAVAQLGAVFAAASNLAAVGGRR